MAAATSWVTTTPLPAANPSSLITCGAPKASMAACTCSGVVHTRDIAVGTPAAAMISLANALDPSSLAASRPGPNTAIPVARTASATPATSGPSGPMTTRSEPTRTASRATSWGSSGRTGRFVAIVPVPGLPGAATTSVTAGSATRDRARACSRAPAPMSRIRTTTESTPFFTLARRPRAEPTPQAPALRRAVSAAQVLGVGPLGEELFQIGAQGHVPEQRDGVAKLGRGTGHLASDLSGFIVDDA